MAFAPREHPANEDRRRIERVLAEDAFHIVFQPIVDLRSGEVRGAEALARFTCAPQRSPDQWFDEAWGVGLGLELELAAIKKSLAALNGLPPNTYVAINADPRTIRSDGLLDLLATVPAERVVVELTEHARVDDYVALAAAISRFRALGTRLSVDDAGAGFASFQHVLSLRPDIIKLDRSLTTDVDKDPVRNALASAFVTFADSLGARICAEGVERAGELVALQKIGVSKAQGYFLARPGPLPLSSPPVGFWFAPPTKVRRENFLQGSSAVRDARRLAALADTDLLDSAREEDFDRFSRFAARLLGAPVALVSLVDENRQYFKSALGLSEPWATLRETPLTHSFCQHAVTTKQPLVINDAREHPLVRESLAVSELGVVAYVGVPLVTSEELALGALCAVDTKPREWSAADVEILQDLAALLLAQIELRQARRDQRDHEALYRRIFDQTNAAVVLCDVRGRISRASSKFCELGGVPSSATAITTRTRPA